MYLKTLIEKLEKAFEDNGNIQVTVYADHGQTEMSAESISIEYVGSDGDTVDKEEITGTETKVLSIYGDGYVS